MAKLFLLAEDYSDKKIDDNQFYYCPHCLMIEGVLQFYPQLEEMLEIIYVDFQRPRKEIIQLVGEENQACPNIIIHKNETSKMDMGDFKEIGEYYFSSSINLITEYLTKRLKSDLFDANPN